MRLSESPGSRLIMSNIRRQRAGWADPGTNTISTDPLLRRLSKFDLRGPQIHCRRPLMIHDLYPNFAKSSTPVSFPVDEAPLSLPPTGLPPRTNHHEPVVLAQADRPKWSAQGLHPTSLMTASGNGLAWHPGPRCPVFEHQGCNAAFTSTTGFQLHGGPMRVILMLGSNLHA